MRNADSCLKEGNLGWRAGVSRALRGRNPQKVSERVARGHRPLGSRKCLEQSQKSLQKKKTDPEFPRKAPKTTPPPRPESLHFWFLGGYFSGISGESWRCSPHVQNFGPQGIFRHFWWKVRVRPSRVSVAGRDFLGRSTVLNRSCSLRSTYECPMRIEYVSAHWRTLAARLLALIISLRVHFAVAAHPLLIGWQAFRPKLTMIFFSLVFLAFWKTVGLQKCFVKCLGGEVFGCHNPGHFWGTE